MKGCVARFIRWCSNMHRIYSAKKMQVPRKLYSNRNISNGNILIIVPHADDELIGCHQFIKKHSNNITLFYCGLLGTNPLEENRETRLKEFLNYCNNNNINYVKVNNNANIELLNHIKNNIIDTIVIPSIIDWHEEHRIINKYLTNYLTHNNQIKIRSIVWYHISVPMYACSSNYACIMTKDEQKRKWIVFKDCYKSQKNIDINRFKLAEKDCIEGYYSAETFLVMTVKEYLSKMEKSTEITHKLNNLKFELVNYTKLVTMSIRFYKQLI